MLYAEWITNVQAGYISGAFGIGLLLGASLCVKLARKFSAGIACRGFLILGLAGTVSSAVYLGPWFLGASRFLTGFAVAGVSILTMGLITEGIKRSARGPAIALGCFGGGLGTIIISLSLPFAPISLESGPQWGWYFTAALCAIGILIAWPGIRTREDTVEFIRNTAKRFENRSRLILLAASYCLLWLGTAPTLLYISAYINSDYDITLQYSALAYVAVGLGYSLGGLTADALFTRWIGRYSSLILANAIALVSCFAVLYWHNLWIPIAAAFLITLSVSGASTLKTHDILELAGPLREIRWLSIFKIASGLCAALSFFIAGLFLMFNNGYTEMYWLSVVSFSGSLVLAFFITLPKDKPRQNDNTPQDSLKLPTQPSHS